jgi:retron-type reverse transcriptase
VSLITPETVEKLQTTLHAKAKESHSYRFYSLYDKMYRLDVLRHAYRICRLNDGAPGVDGTTFDDIEAFGVTKWLRELAEEIRTKSYRPDAVRRVLIPKPGHPDVFVR